MNEIINSLFLTKSAFSMIDLFLALLIPFLITFIIIWSYQRIQRNNSFNNEFLYSLFLFAIVGSFMTLIIGENIARAFGLVGALSIIRFRTAVKSSLDSLYMLWALAIGLACGTQNYIAALYLTIFISFVLTILSKIKLKKKSLNYILKTNHLDIEELLKDLKIDYQIISKSNEFISLNIICETLDQLKSKLDSKDGSYEIFDNSARPFL